MKPLYAIIAGLALLFGSFGVQYGPSAYDSVAEWSGLAASGKPVQAIVVRESLTVKTDFTSAQVAMLNSPKLRADAKVAGVAFLVVDPDVKDATGKTPAELTPAIERAKAKGLPRLITVGTRGGLMDYIVPTDEAAMRTRLGVP
jgi:hypothetical protein